MRIPRLFHPELLAPDSEVNLSREASRHVRTVLRLKSGAALVLFDGSGTEFQVRLHGDGGERVRVAVLGARRPAVESPLLVTLVQGISRGERMDYTVQKAVELGVAEIAPVLTERSVTRIDAADAERKRRHWQAVAVAACEQSGRVHVPRVQPVVSLHQFLQASPAAACRLLLDPAADTVMTRIPAPANGRVLLLVGPEGGLNTAEATAVRAAGFSGVRLGPRVLRTETASVAALSLMQAFWGDMR